MLKVPFIIFNCLLAVCHSIELDEPQEPQKPSFNIQNLLKPQQSNDFIQQAIMNVFQSSLDTMKQDYLKKFEQVKSEAIGCTFGGSCAYFLDKIKVSEKIRKYNFLKCQIKCEFCCCCQNLTNGFRHDAEHLRDFHKKSLHIFDRRNYIRCLDCVEDYLDEMFGEFCDFMDDTELNGKGNNITILTLNRRF